MTLHMQQGVLKGTLVTPGQQTSLLSVYTAVLRVYTALLRVYTALLRVYSALLRGYGSVPLNRELWAV